MAQVPLTAFATVTLDGSGNGTASTGPTGSGEVWDSVLVSVHASTNVSEAVCRVYAGGSVSPATFADGTFTGSTGDSSDNIPGSLRTGNQVFAVWSGGDAGATAYLSVTGTKTVA